MNKWVHQNEKRFKFTIASRWKFMGYREIVGATIYKDKLSKISFWIKSYHKDDKSEYYNKHRYVLTYKAGQINILRLGKEESGWTIKNQSNNLNLLNELGIVDGETQRKEIKRAARTINKWLILNKSRKRLDLKGLTRENFKPRLLKLIYPSLNHFDFECSGINSAISRYFRHGWGLKKIIKKCLGFSGKKTTNLVVNEISRSERFSLLAFGSLIKGLIPIDDINELIERGLNVSAIHTNLRPFLKQFSEPRRKTLIYEGFGAKTPLFNSYFSVRDTIRMWLQLKEAKVSVEVSDLKTWTAIHDCYSREINRINNPEKEINYPDYIKVLDGAIIGDMRVELPKTNYDLVRFGQVLSNCIGSYQNAAINGTSILVGIYKGEELTYNIELRPALGRYKDVNIIQFSGKRNSRPDPKDREVFENFLYEQDLMAQPKPPEPVRPYNPVMNQAPAAAPINNPLLEDEILAF